MVDYSPAAISAYREKGGLPNQKLIDKQGITWNLITSADNAFRIKREGNAYSSAAPTIISIDDVDISDNTTVLSLLGQLNSKSTAYILEGLNPTLNTTIHDVTRLPLFKSSNQIALIVIENLSISSADWSESETAGSFLTFSLVTNIAEHTVLAIQHIQQCLSNICVTVEHQAQKLTTWWHKIQNVPKKCQTFGLGGH